MIYSWKWLIIDSRLHQNLPMSMSKSVWMNSNRSTGMGQSRYSSMYFVRNSSEIHKSKPCCTLELFLPNDNSCYMPNDSDRVVAVGSDAFHRTDKTGGNSRANTWITRIFFRHRTNDTKWRIFGANVQNFEHDFTSKNRKSSFPPIFWLSPLFPRLRSTSIQKIVLESLDDPCRARHENTRKVFETEGGFRLEFPPVALAITRSEASRQ